MSGDASEHSAGWTALLEETAAIADRYRDDGWDVVVLEPVDVTPVDGDCVGFDLAVSEAEYGLVETLVADRDVRFDGAEIYHRQGANDDRRFVLAAERDEASATAVFLPLTYTLSTAHGTFERALGDEQLQVYVRAPSAGESIVFSHDDPSLFLEDADVLEWNNS